MTPSKVPSTYSSRSGSTSCAKLNIISKTSVENTLSVLSIIMIMSNISFFKANLHVQ